MTHGGYEMFTGKLGWRLVTLSAGHVTLKCRACYDAVKYS